MRPPSRDADLVPDSNDDADDTDDVDRTVTDQVDDGVCASCGAPHARTWSTPEGPARLCPSCATLHGLGCP